jgi:hypothetical protein
MTLTSGVRRRPETGLVASYLRELRRAARESAVTEERPRASRSAAARETKPNRRRATSAS